MGIGEAPIALELKQNSERGVGDPTGGQTWGYRILCGEDDPD